MYISGRVRMHWVSFTINKIIVKYNREKEKAGVWKPAFFLVNQGWLVRSLDEMRRENAVLHLRVWVEVLKVFFR